MEGYNNCNGNNSEVGGETEPGEEGALVGAVVTAVRCKVGEEQGAKERPGKEGDGCRSVQSMGEHGALVAQRVHGIAGMAYCSIKTGRLFRGT